MTDIKPGDRVQVGGYVCTVEAVSGPDQVVCLRYPDGSLGLERESVLTLIAPKIAEPLVGSGVWDDGVLWIRGAHGWFSYDSAANVIACRWPDFSDDVTLAVDPKAGAR